MTTATTCRRCGVEFGQNHNVVLAAACRDRDEVEAERLLTDERAARRARPRDWWRADQGRRRGKAGRLANG